MSKVKTTYSVAEAKKLLECMDYVLTRQGKHPIYTTNNYMRIAQQKKAYSLTITHDPLRQGTTKGLRDFLGFQTWEQLHKYWMSIK